MAANYTAYLPESFFEDNGSGIGQVTILRIKSLQKVEAGVFLVDHFCLGIRDAFYYQGTESGIMERIHEGPDSLRKFPGAFGRKFIEEAVAYARQFGFAPHKDFKKAARVFGGLTAAPDLDGFTFGHGGKPFYVQSRSHDAADVERIVGQLRRVCGEGGFDYLLTVDDESFDM